MIADVSSQSVPEGSGNRPQPSRREVIAAAATATTLLAWSAASSPAEAATGAEGYFLTFDTAPGPEPDRIFFIPSAWLELFEVTDVYKARYSTAQWNQTLAKMRSAAPHARRKKISALYADVTDLGVQPPFPGSTVIPPVPPGANQTYLAAMIAPSGIP